MPLLLTRHPFPDTTFGLWQIAEEEAFFRDELPLSEAEETEVTRLKNDLRRHEWFAGRWLLHKLSGAPQRLPLAKDAFSKPFFPENRSLACSLSHSHGVVGALISDCGLGIADCGASAPSEIGCDVQVLVEKMSRLAGKFLSAEEELFIANHPQSVQFDLLHVFWTAKESLYKAYGLKELDFRTHMRIEPFHWEDGRTSARGWVEKQEYRQAFRLHSEKIDLPDSGALIWTVGVPETVSPP